jgi:C4-dicarboxylate transporter DctM subunit
VLGMLIPPSILLIIYAVLAEQSVGHMFLAGIIPGLILTAAYSLGILAVGYLWPNAVQLLAERERHTVAARTDRGIGWMARKMLPICILIVIVLGGIYGGVYTPTEAGAAGAAGALVIALVRRKLTLAAFWRILVDTGHVTATILFLVISASMYSHMLGVSGLPTQIGRWIGSLDAGFAELMAIYILILLVRGTLIDSVSIILIMVPLFLAVLEPYHIDLVWFGIVTTIGVEIGLLTPPMGIAVFVIKATLQDAGYTLGDIFAGATPFTAVMFLVLLLIIMVPSLSTALI